MWAKILELVLGKAIDRLGRETAPRERLAKAFTALFASMTRCHRAYLAFRQDRAASFLVWRDADEDYEYQAREDHWRSMEVAGKEWVQAILSVARALEAVRIALDVREPELLNTLDSYIDGESVAAYAAQQEGLPIYYLVGAIGRSLPGSSVADPQVYCDLQNLDRVDFESAVSRLREFMREDLQLSTEELLDESKAV